MAVTVDTIEALAKKALKAKYGDKEGDAIAFLLMGGYGVPGIVDGATLAAKANMNVEAGIDFTEDMAASLVSDAAQAGIIAALVLAGVAVATATAIAVPLVIGLKGLLSSGTEIGPEHLPGIPIGVSPISDTPITSPISTPIIIPPSIPIVLPTIGAPPPPTVEPPPPPPTVEPPPPPPTVEPPPPPPTVEPPPPPPTVEPPPAIPNILGGGGGSGNGGAIGATTGGIGPGAITGNGTAYAGPDGSEIGGGETTEGGSHIHHIPHFVAFLANLLKPKR